MLPLLNRVVPNSKTLLAKRRGKLTVCTRVGAWTHHGVRLAAKQKALSYAFKSASRGRAQS